MLTESITNIDNFVFNLDQPKDPEVQPNTTAYQETMCKVFQADKKTNLLARIWLPKKEVKAIFLAIHGGMAHGGDWVTPALFFKEKGVATFALDMRWHGTFPKYNKNGKVLFHIDSYNEFTTDTHEFYKWIKEQYPNVPIFVLSHSNGALIALKYALSHGKDDDINGFIMSSPWLKNKVVVPKILLFLAKIIAAIAPKFAVSPESVTDKLTHDRAITARHHKDEISGIKGTKATAKLGVESLKTQKWVLDKIASWNKFPLFAVIAGQDYLADPKVSEDALKTIPAELLEFVKYENNYHENFNEVNREEIYMAIWQWMQNRM